MGKFKKPHCLFFTYFVPVKYFNDLNANWHTCNIHIIVQGDHGVAPLVWIWEIWELMPLPCTEKEIVRHIFTVNENTLGTETTQRHTVQTYIAFRYSSVLTNSFCYSSANKSAVFFFL